MKSWLKLLGLAVIFGAILVLGVGMLTFVLAFFGILLLFAVVMHVLGAPLKIKQTVTDPLTGRKTTEVIAIYRRFRRIK